MATAGIVNEQAGSGAGRPKTMKMTIQGGLLPTLGINLYENMGKVLAEFIANAYDSDATEVRITIPIDRIQQERQRAKAEADARRREYEDRQAGQEKLALETQGTAANDGVEAKAPLNLDVLFETLPEDIQVVVTDDGHGMTWEDVEKKFLPLNRRRRMDKATGKETDVQSPGGRWVMGRKGVGKLAGFGGALTVDLWTKREGDSSATKLRLTDEELNAPDKAVNEVDIKVDYDDGLDPTRRGTTITLSRLKAEATRDSLDKIKKVIGKTFHAIRPEDFAIYVNDEQMTFELPPYELIYPTDLDRDAIAAGKRATQTVDVPGVGSLDIRYFVGFLPKAHPSGTDRGAIIYCNNRLAAGPALFGMPPGMHSFHSVDYMECVIEADELDRSDIDFINTARTGVKEGNEVVEALRQAIVAVMKKAVNAHAKFREEKAKEELKSDPVARVIAQTIEQLPKKTRVAGRRLLHTIARTFEVGSIEFEELAPVIVHSINATEVLIQLASKGTAPESISVIMGQLHQLSEIEKRDALKLYRARRGGIEKLAIMAEKGREHWKKKQFEKEFHALMKENPWLIRPEFSNYISSDQGINTTVSVLARELKVDEFAPIVDGDDESTVRPDLVYLMSDPMVEGPHTVKVVELKSPALPLKIQHFRQLQDYIAAVEFWCRANLPHTVRVNGYLIGAMPDENASVLAEKQLVDEFQKAGPREQIQILGFQEMLHMARRVHEEAIRAFQRDLDAFGDEDAEAEDGEEAGGLDLVPYADVDDATSSGEA